MAKRDDRRRSRRAFWCAFALTLCVLLTGAGFLVADYNTRLTGFGDVTLSAGLQQETPLDGEEEPVLTEPGWLDAAWQLLPARWRVAVWVAEGEIASVTQALTALFG